MRHLEQHRIKPRQKKLLLAGIMGLAIVVASIDYSQPRRRNEPIYQGKTLSQWLKQLDDGQAFGISSGSLPRLTGKQTEAADAIRAMGTNALPLLMQDIHSTPARESVRFKIEDRLDSWMRGITGRQRLIWDLMGDTTEEDRQRWRAAQGLAALGPLATTAIPELKRLLFTNYWHSSIKEAAYALATAGPEGMEVLRSAIEPLSGGPVPPGTTANSADWSAMCAVWALGQHPETGTNAIPLLIAATRSSSEGTACGAIQVLGLFHVDGESVIPALTNVLGDPSASWAARQDAAKALAQFGGQAAIATPLLRKLTKDPALGPSASEALRKIESAK